MDRWAHRAVRTVPRTKGRALLIVPIHAESLSRLTDQLEVSMNLRPRAVNLLPRQRLHSRVDGVDLKIVHRCFLFGGHPPRPYIYIIPPWWWGTNPETKTFSTLRRHPASPRHRKGGGLWTAQIGGGGICPAHKPPHDMVCLRHSCLILGISSRSCPGGVPRSAEPGTLRHAAEGQTSCPDLHRTICISKCRVVG